MGVAVMHEIPDTIYRVAAAAVVMSGKNFTNYDQSGPTVYTRIKLKKEIYDFLRTEGLNIDVVVNRLLESFIVAYKAFWDSYKENGMLRPGFEPGSRDRESRMIGRATPPELAFADFKGRLITFSLKN